MSEPKPGKKRDNRNKRLQQLIDELRGRLSGVTYVKTVSRDQKERSSEQLSTANQLAQLAAAVATLAAQILSAGGTADASPPKNPTPLVAKAYSEQNVAPINQQLPHEAKLRTEESEVTVRTEDSLKDIRIKSTSSTSGSSETHEQDIHIVIRDDGDMEVSKDEPEENVRN